VKVNSKIYYIDRKQDKKNKMLKIIKRGFRPDGENEVKIKGGKDERKWKKEWVDKK